MPYLKQIVAEKANIINRNKKIYGTFAEIGAGQEVVNHFFKAGLASQTIAKSMSAYDMTFSDLIYGKAGRYVCEKRLSQMLNHEYSLLKNRLKSKKSNCCFFAFADTAAVSTFKKSNKANHHGWMGLRFQAHPGAVYDEILLHLNLLDRTRLQQYEVLGVLGVNLIHTAFYGKKQASSMIHALVDNFEKTRVEIDVMKCRGPHFKNLNTFSLNKELLKQDLTPIIVMNPRITAPMDAFYSRSIVLHSGGFTRSAYLKIQKKLKPLSFLCIKNKNAPSKCSSATIIHTCKYWHELKNTIRQYTDQEIMIYLSPKELAEFLNEKNYSSLNMIQVMGIFFDRKTKIISNMKKENFHYNGLAKSLLEKKLILLEP